MASSRDTLPSRCKTCDCAQAGVVLCWNCGGTLLETPYWKCSVGALFHALRLQDILEPEALETYNRLCGESQRDAGGK